MATCNEPNPYTYSPVPAQTDIHFACTAHAGYYQKVTITLNGETKVLQGSGENVPMLTPGGNPTVTINSGNATSVQVTFQYSPGGSGGPFQLAAVCAPNTVNAGPITLVNQSSEDSTDHDDNDSYLQIYWLNRS